MGPRTWIACVLIAAAGDPSRAADGPVVEPIDIGFTERTGRSLLFLDVEAVDAVGRPLVGLRKDDFKIRVNYVWRKIYSVDDLCPCADAGSPVAAGAGAPADPAREARLALAATPPHFVLYFDFSQMQESGREQALREAERWAVEVLQPGDRVMVVAFSTAAGLRRLSEFTEDHAAVAAAIRKAGADPDLRDPFPADHAARQQMCDDGTLSCYSVGRMEFFHARRSLETLRNFLTDLDDVAPRKTMLLFHENASIFPGRLYGEGAGYLPQSTWDRLDSLREPGFDRARALRADSALVPDLLELSQEVGGSATASRTVVYPVACGTASTWTVNLGANIADGTGGEYNRRPDDVAALLAEAGRRCACVYRIGLEMDDERRSFVLRTKVRARGVTLPSRYEVQYLTDADRWMRKAQLVLANPESWRDLDVGAAVVPVRPHGGRWEVRAEVAFDLSALGVGLDEEDRPAAEWEVAALLSDAEGERHWEMLGSYRAAPGADGRIGSWMLHARTVADLRPGRYEIRAFVHDRTTDTFGAARTEIELPGPGQAGLVGPVTQRPDTPHLSAELPLRDRKPAAASRAISGTAVGPLPLGDEPAVAQGLPVRFVTLVCGAGGAMRSAVRHGESERSYQEKREIVKAAGACTPLAQTVETWAIAPGRYVYEIEREGGDGAEAAFEVVSASR